jgi:hypothetical protein
MDICSECGKPCEEVERRESISYSYRDHNCTDTYSVYVSDCCGEEVRRVNEDEMEDDNE